MPEPDRAMTYDEQRAATDAAIRLLHTAAVHLFQTRPETFPRRRARDTLDFDTATAVERYGQFTRMFSNWIGQPERCALSRCRRAKLCQGDPADCWRDDPPPTADEMDTAKWMLKDMIGGELARRRAAGELPAESP